jgi:predicted phosphodiesterase
VSGNLSSIEIAGQMEIHVAVEPIDVSIPLAWNKVENWQVFLVPSVMRMDLTYKLNVIQIRPVNNPGIFISEGLDTTQIYTSALGLICDIPDSLPPILYDVVVAFSASNVEISEFLGQYSPKPGSWKSQDGKAATSFIISEPSCIYFPWINDAKSSDDVKTFGSHGHIANPFSMLHITDTHYTDNPYILGNNSGWEFDIKVLAPELLVISGDIMENPGRNISEYDIIYERLIQYGVPALLTSGNHDQKNLGPWYHYIGNSFGTLIWDDVKVVYMTNILPIGTPVFEYMDKCFVENKKPVNLFTFHYPPETGYASSSWLSLLQIALKNNIDAILSGHYHADAVVPIADYYSLTATNKGGERTFLTHLTELAKDAKYSGPITQPYLILTRSAGKVGSSLSTYNSEIGEDDYSGYRRMVIQNNKITNYTYSFGLSGERDAHNSTPVGRYNMTIEKNTNFGTDPNAKANITLINNMNEYIPSARIPVLLENAPNGKVWTPSAEDLANGVYIRTKISNSTHTWLDIRTPIVPNQDIMVTIEAADGG